MTALDNIILNESQEKALKQMKNFAISILDRCFILTGYAGTGKTTLMRFFIDYLIQRKINFVLLSTTGRAAKILSNYTGHSARTIHSLIYSYEGLNKDLSDVQDELISMDSIGQLYINFEAITIDEDADQTSPTIYIIDESSMISDTASENVTQARFGSGKLLTNLLNYDTCAKTKYVFVGDPCQLPPIEGKTSPALDKDYIVKHFHYGVKSASLTQVMRQDDGSSIVLAAEMIRQLWENAPLYEYEYGNKTWGILPLSCYPDIHFYSELNEMIEEYLTDIKQNGYNESIFICQSNKDTNKISQHIRRRLGFTDILHKGDLLMVQQNQYTTGLMNGDMVEVVSINPAKSKTFPVETPSAYRSDLIFREVTVKELFSKKQYTTLIIETLLMSGQNNLDTYQQTGLFLDFALRMKKKGINQKKNKGLFYDCMCEDPFLNALRCTYGYAVTCHKAQGGEWNKAFIHFCRRNITLNPTKEIYQWIYTALTRAKKHVGFIKEFYIK